MFLTLLLLVVFVACFASLMNNGLWSNTITLVNVISAALLATNYFEPLADFFDKQEPSFTYAWDFITVWLLFGVIFAAFRALTDYLSQVKVRFFQPVDQVGGILFACWTGWIMICFTTMTLHTAPLARNFLGGAFQATPEAKMFFGLAPDRIWLGWMHKESRGSFCRLKEIVPFDGHGDFILRYGGRREEFEKQLTLTKAATPASETKGP